MFLVIIKLNLVKDLLDYVDKVMPVHNIIIAKTKGEVQENTSTGELQKQNFQIYLKFLFLLELILFVLVINYCLIF